MMTVLSFCDLVMRNIWFVSRLHKQGCLLGLFSCCRRGNSRETTPITTLEPLPGICLERSLSLLPHLQLFKLAHCPKSCLFWNIHCTWALFFNLRQTSVNASKNRGRKEEILFIDINTPPFSSNN